MKADELLKAGRLTEALAALQQQVRDDPADPKLRVFLFQLLAVLGQWDKALTQLNISADMDPANLLMAQICRDALAAEAFRAEVFAGRRLPLVFGEPPEWVGLLLQSNQVAETGGGSPDAARELRERAFEAAPTTSGTINGEPFEWIADSDMRLGPMLEAVIQGKYFWVPFQHVREIKIEKPTDLRDLVWLEASFTWTNGGTAAGLIPTRYPGSEAAEPALALARRTEWATRGDGASTGTGQRVLATDASEYPLLEVRHVVLGEPVGRDGGGGAEEAGAASDAGGAGGHA
jgi:type VI secretion system protein ImpE